METKKYLKDRVSVLEKEVQFLKVKLKDNKPISLSSPG